MAEAGKFRDRITVERLVPGADQIGNTVYDWADHLTVWADMLERLGKERLEAGTLEASRMATIRVRQSADTLGLTEADRVQARGQVWNIRSIAAVGRKNELLEMTCEAGVAT